MPSPKCRQQDLAIRLGAPMDIVKAPPGTAAAAAISGEDDLVLYWDSRYHRYFYAGAMTPPTGQLYDLAGTPVMRPTDYQKWSRVELEQEERPAGSSVRPLARSIISRPDRLGWSKGPKLRRRISWSPLSLPYSEVIPPEKSLDKDEGPISFTLHTTICLTIVFVLVLLVLFWLWEFTAGGSHITDESTIDPDLTTEGGLIVRPFIARTDHPTLLPPTITATGIRGRLLQESNNGSSPGPGILTPLMR